MKPPALADWVLRVLVRDGAAGDVIGDLHEEFSRFQLEALGPVRSRIWYWRQTLGVLVRYGRVRLPTWSRSSTLIGDTREPGRSLAVGLVADVRSAYRRLVVSPVLSVTTVGTLALGIGVTSAVFGAVNGVLLEPLPYGEPHELVVVEGWLLGVGGGRFGASPPEFRAFREGATTLSDLAATWPTAANLFSEEAPAPLSAVLVTTNLFPLLKVAPARGRGFRPGDVEGGVGYVAVVSYSAWQTLFDSDPELIGKEVEVDGDLLTVIGIMPRGFRHPGYRGPKPVDLWVPMNLVEDERFDEAAIRDLTLVGRLEEGATLDQSREELERIAAAHRGTHPDQYPLEAEWAVSVDPLLERVVGEARPVLLLLFGSVGLVLLAVITNVASLQLARGAARFRELAVRAAIGGSRARITRQLFIESLLLGLIGGAGGLALAFWGTRALRGLATRRFPRIDLIQVDGAVLFFVLGISFLSVVGFGLVPALRYARTPARRVMEEGAGGRDSGRYSLRRTLVGLQTAVAVVLFVGAGLLFKSYRVVGSVDLGFDPDRVLTLATWLPVPNEAGQGGYEVPERRIGFFDRVLDEMIQISGVEHAGMTSILPFHGTSRLPVGVKGGRDADGAGLPLAESRIVSGGYFRAMGIELLSGRTFRRSDALGGPLVAIVNRAFVERYFAGEDPLGQAIQVRIPQSWWLEVVGVVEDVTHGPMGRPPAETVYTSFRQYGSAMIAMSFVLNTSDRPEAYADAAVAALQRVDPDVPAFDVAPMGQLLSEARRQERLQTVFFALVSLLTGALAALGVYGVVSSSVAQRSGEIGVRLALGGARTGILRMLLSEGMRLGALGASTGLVLAVASTLLLRSFLHGVQPTDLGIMAGAVALTLSLVTLASLVPALDATRIDPAEIIKAD